MIIGIDPGITGAISFFDDDGKFLGVEDMPTMALNNKKQINPVALNDLLQLVPFSLFFSEEMRASQVAYLEKVHAMPGQGVSSMFNFGMGYGVIQGVLAANEVPLHLVTPQKWKKHQGLIGKDKDCARTLAQQLYPQASLSRKKDIGRADAMLIGDYGVQQKKIGV